MFTIRKKQTSPKWHCGKIYMAVHSLPGQWYRQMSAVDGDIMPDKIDGPME